MFTKVWKSFVTVVCLLVVASFTHQMIEVHRMNQNVLPSIEEQLQSVVTLTTGMENYCSGWVLKGEHKVVTAAHCLPNDDPTASVLVDFGDGKPHVFHAEKVGDKFWTRGPDLMVLTTNDTSIKWPTGFEVCKFKAFYGERLRLLGAPLGIANSATTGMVSNPLTALKEDIGVAPWNKLIEFDGQLIPGNSGGPAVDIEENCVMGSAEAIRNVAPESGVPFGVNFLTPISELTDLV